MNKKQLLIAALATIMSISAASATNITGANLQNGVYNISPEKINGDVGYRQYSNFDLSQGDVAKLIYQGHKSGELRDLGTFINLVGNEVKINGVLNAVKADGTGHAVFITPTGFTVGGSGVINAGTLSVITPTATKFNSLTNEYAADNFANINQISKMRNNAAINNNNYGGNAAVAIMGHVFTRNGADIRGSQVIVDGGIVNGYKPANDFTATNFDGKTSAAALFNSLVNTNGIIAPANQVSTKGTSIVIKSGAGTSEYNNISVGGKIANLDNGETVITNHGDAGLTLKGATVAGNGKVNIYNNNATGKLTITDDVNHNSSLVVAHKGDLSVTSKGGMDVATANRLVAKNNVEVVNKGGALNFAGAAVAENKVDVVNSGAQGAAISGSLGTEAQHSNTVRIVNENGKLTFTGKAHANDSVSIRNQATANGLEVGGTVKAGEGVLVHNKAGNALLNGEIEVTGAKVKANGAENTAIAIYNEGTGKLSTAAASKITADDGNIAIKNDATQGMALAGTITNKAGETAINNNAGAMTVNGTIANNGNMGIINRGAGEMNVGATVNNTGKLKLANVNGDGFEINGKVTNANGNFSIYNDKGHLDINNDLTNSNGYLYIHSRNASEGVASAAGTTIKNTNGNLAIKHNGSGTDMLNKGIDLKGNVVKDGANGELAINNFKGDMHVGGTVTTNTKTGIINRAGSEDLNVDATINALNNKELRIKNEVGTGNMEVAGTINHNGRLNVLTNNGTLTLNGKVNNSGTDRTYAIARSQADGIEVTNNFNAQSTNGMIYILNKVGQDGLKYQGTAKATNAQVELYSLKGDMVVNGGSVEGNPTIILNRGDNLTVTNAAAATGKDVKIVNNGKNPATIGTNHTKNFYEKLAK